MQILPTNIPELLLCKPLIFRDNRGYFFESFNQKEFTEKTKIEVNFCQDNEAKSTKGVLRGLHYQLPPFAQSKLVRVVKGKVLDIAVDIRKNSPTFGEHIAIELSEENKYQLYIPKGFAHGYVVLSDEAIFSYKVDAFYNAEYDTGILFNDKELNINWQLAEENLIISEKDMQQPVFANAKYF